MLVAPVAAAFAFSRSNLFGSLSKASTLPLPPIKAAKHHPCRYSRITFNAYRQVAETDAAIFVDSITYLTATALKTSVRSWASSHMQVSKLTKGLQFKQQGQ